MTGLGQDLLNFLRSRDPGAGGTAKKDNLITDPRADGHSNGRRDW